MGFPSLETIFLHRMQNEMQAMQQELHRMQNLLPWKRKDLLWKQNAPLEVDVWRREPTVPRSLADVI